MDETSQTLPEAAASEPSIEGLSRALAELVHTASPAISSLARWALEHPQEMAFHSVRGLAQLANTNVNTVYRLAVALKFSGFEECRAAFQAAMRNSGGLYGQRAAQLSSGGDGGLFSGLQKSTSDNLDALFADEFIGRIKETSKLLQSARKVYCVGVRSGFSLAHYMAYSGRMAFENFARPLSEPGSIADALTETNDQDAVVLITFSRYSAEVVRAHSAARGRGAKIIAITDSYASPIARDASVVFAVPMSGPQTLPSQAVGFTLVEAIIAHMISESSDAPTRISDFEPRLVEIGSYASADSDVLD